MYCQYTKSLLHTLHTPNMIYDDSRAYLELQKLTTNVIFLKKSISTESCMSRRTVHPSLTQQEAILA